MTNETKPYLLHLTAGEFEGLLDGSGSVIDALEGAEPETDATLQEIGRSALHRAYYADVRSMAEEIVSEAAGETTDTGEDADWDELRERADELTHENVDGSAWVIYTGQAMDVLRVSENDTAFEDAGDVPSAEDCTFWSVMAYHAMHQDVSEAVERIISTREEEANDEAS